MNIWSGVPKIRYQRLEFTSVVSFKKHVRTFTPHCKYMLSVLIHQLCFEDPQQQVNKKISKKQYYLTWNLI